MSEQKVYTVIGLMSGTSTDGVDAAMLRTDGFNYIEPLGFVEIPYDDVFRSRIKAQFGKPDYDDDVRAVEREITLKHVEAVRTLIEKTGIQDVDLIGFHGQTIFHDPNHGQTIQIGDGAFLAQETGIDVVYDFRSADVEAGGQGAPLIPLYHQAIARSQNIDLPCAILNIGGVSNVTWIGCDQDHLQAFDCGAGNALIDDVMVSELGRAYDNKGTTAKQGSCDQSVLERLISNDYFRKRPPKSLDRDAWDLSPIRHLSPEDKVATLTEFTVQAIIRAQNHFPQPVQSWHVCGGGRHNTTMMERLFEGVNGGIFSIDTLGMNGDALEAEGFGYLAVRSIQNSPLSLPTTTGVKVPQTGGVLVKAVS